MKTEQRWLVWRYFWSAALIAATVGVASVVALWTGHLG
jgi:hypothetical protein